MPGLLSRLTWRDWAVPAALWVAGQLELWVVGPQTIAVHGPRWPFAACLTVSALAICVRRSHPVIAVTLVVGSIAATTAPQLYGFLLLELYMLGVAVFACGRYGVGTTRYAAVLLPEIAVLRWAAVIPELRPVHAWAWGLNSVWVFALGAAFRRERLLREQVSQTAAAQSRAQAAEQRLSLAREVHDVVSHSLSVVVVQSELARLFMTSDPARADQAIGRVQATGRDALGETRRLLDALRDPAQTNPTALPPTWPDVPELVRRMRESGLQIALDTPEVDPPLSPEASATAYRVVQEALTNALRHARTSPTSVEVTRAENRLIIDVHNDADPTGVVDRSAAASGYGLSGMQERVVACGGLLTAGPRPGGGYQVVAVLPLEDTA